MSERNSTSTPLEVFVGEWSMEPRFDDKAPTDGGARVVFEWLPGKRFLIQRWSVPVPEAPDGIAIIGEDPSNTGQYLQHYFDSRGVARIYQMTLEGDVWSLVRHQADSSPLDFGQRYIGSISSDGQTITGYWEISHDGTTWQNDFELMYRKLSA
jgi:hypothetical protein